MPVAVLAALLPLISWKNIQIVADLNGWLHHSQSDEAGWTIYTAVRLVLFGCLVACISRLNAGSDSLEISPSGAPGTPAAKKSPGFDPLMGLRALAAVMVILGHYFIVLLQYREPATAFAHKLFTLLRSSPWAGVWTFFTLSGFLMSKGFSSGRYTVTPQSVFSFYRNRFLRIVPLYVGGFLFVTLLVEPVLFHPSKWWQLVEVLVFDYRGDLPLNPMSALWSVSTEVQFYMLVPFLFLGLQFVHRRAAGVLPFVALILLGLGYSFRRYLASSDPSSYFSYGYTPLLPNLDVFLGGMTLSFLKLPERPGKNVRRFSRTALPLIAVALFVLTAKLTGVYLGRQTNYMWRLLPPLTCVFAAAFIICAQLAGRIEFGTGLRAALLRGVTRVGTLTYALYILHSQILLRFRMTLKPDFPLDLSPADSLKYLPLLLLLVWLTAESAYRFVEEPFERRKHVRGSALLNAP